MCGIAGIVKFGDEPIEESIIASLLTGNEIRGNDAAGLAFSQADGTINVHKADMPAWQFVASKEYKDFINRYLKSSTWGVILHTRSATKGNPNDNKNNHPMFAGLSTIVHNGVIYNDDYMFTSEKIVRQAETDSDIIRGFVDKYGLTPKCVEKLNHLSGCAAGAAFHPKFPKKMMLFRSGNPMVLASNENFFMFSSEKGPLYTANKPYIKRWNMWFHIERPKLGFSVMANDTAWIIGEDGQEFHGLFKILINGAYTEPNRRTYENYQERKNKWSKNAKKDAYCVSCKKMWVVPKDDKVEEYTCNKSKGGCGAFLTEPPTKK